MWIRAKGVIQEMMVEMGKVRVCVTLPKDVVDWIDEMVRKRVYATRSHAIEVCVRKEMEKTEA